MTHDRKDDANTLLLKYRSSGAMSDPMVEFFLKEILLVEARRATARVARGRGAARLVLPFMGAHPQLSCADPFHVPFSFATLGRPGP